MYFLRRRHGRKTNPDQRRDKPPAVAQDHQTHQTPALPIYAELDEAVTPPQPVVKTKPRRARIESPEDDCKPAGTFRAGTLHIASRVSQDATRHE